MKELFYLDRADRDVNNVKLMDSPLCRVYMEEKEIPCIYYYNASAWITTGRNTLECQSTSPKSSANPGEYWDSWKSSDDKSRTLHLLLSLSVYRSQLLYIDFFQCAPCCTVFILSHPLFASGVSNLDDNGDDGNKRAPKTRTIQNSNRKMKRVAPYGG